MGKENKESAFLLEWKSSMWSLIKLKHPELSKEKVMKYLDNQIKEHIYNLPLSLVNNYTNKIIKTDALTLIDLIEENQLILGGGGMLYYPHAMKSNILIDFIREVMARRKKFKAERKKYEKGSSEWLSADISQLNAKLV